MSRMLASRARRCDKKSEEDVLVGLLKNIYTLVKDETLTKNDVLSKFNHTLNNFYRLPKKLQKAGFW